MPGGRIVTLKPFHGGHQESLHLTGCQGVLYCSSCRLWFNGADSFDLNDRRNNALGCEEARVVISSTVVGK